ncbi:HAD family hydrolase [Heyndrickxia oleronia]|uniref:HAD hydrolase-like protein n=1 Tax=Heyndrickxia oleronia TaxID=38875 RepID=A0AAW6T3W9_9BACI|nr:HAD family hydrolase [Heyndrickxia oleronia]MDH5164267.1 HAD hydrolase-like protein [Heyndrickxia oleronia]
MIRTILFDVDGVLLSEERYFDASALTVWELLHSKNYLGLESDQFKIVLNDEEITSIRNTVFQNDQVLKFFKSKGLNANWDMIYLTFSFQLIHLLEQVVGEEKENISKWLTSEIDRSVLLEIQESLAQYKATIDYDEFISEFQNAKANSKEDLFDYLNVLVEQKFGIKTNLFSEKNHLWSVCEHVSQEWYVGDENVLYSTGRPSVQLGKKGFLSDEKTLANPEQIGQLFQELTDAGLQIGIGTGRPDLETIKPFEYLNWLNYFDRNHIVTADEVLEAEKQHPSYAPLSKPNPYTFIQAEKGKQTPIASCLKIDLPLENGDQILVVGDSLADLLAARDMGCRFAAVLTGLSGQEARKEFEEHQAEFILDSVLDVKGIVLENVRKG